MNSSIHRKLHLITLTTLVCCVYPFSAARSQPCAATRTYGDQQSAVVPSFLDAWVAKYPSSTLPARMSAQTGRDCNVCHHPPNLNTPGNCYREALTELMNQGMSIQDALSQLDPLDSDGDGVSNGQEALAPRPEPGQIGFNPGLVGDLGTDPCGSNPTTPVTNVSETPPPPPVPAISSWGVVSMALLVVTGASLILRRRPTTIGLVARTIRQAEVAQVEASPQVGAIIRPSL